jgi:glycosyltransferase involved in cell wall biosynthesis
MPSSRDVPSGASPAPTAKEDSFIRGEHADQLHELVVCSLEPWDEIWRRNQFFVDELLRRHPCLRVLFVEPAADVLFDLAERRRPTLPSFRRLTADGRLRGFRPLKPLPRKLGPLADEAVMRQVRLVVRLLGFVRPVLWINDVTYAPLIQRTRWPSLYDVTDDWLLAPFPPREIERLRRLDALALGQADEVVVCSSALAESRGKIRSVSLVPNGVDVEHFRRPRPRPIDLPAHPTAVYVGSLHDARLDVELVAELADALPRLSVILVGPDTLRAESHQLLGSRPNIYFLGPRPYEQVPAYLQHADVLLVPHRISQFTESLDPIKAYECLAVDTPTVATPVAGFRGQQTAILLAERRDFVSHVRDCLSRPARIRRVNQPSGWDERAQVFEKAILAACDRFARSPPPPVS